MIRFVFLDIDDTILDFRWAEETSLVKAYQAVGVTLTPEMHAEYHKMNIQWWERLERGEVTRDYLLSARHKELFDYYGIDADPVEAERQYRYYLGTGYRFMPNAPDCLKYLKTKYKIYAASNGLRVTQYSRLRLAGIDAIFDGILISEDIGYEKPDRRFFEEGTKSIADYDPSESIMIGDSLTSDILGGINAGMDTIWFNARGREPRKDIIPGRTITDLKELYRIL